MSNMKWKPVWVEEGPSETISCKYSHSLRFSWLKTVLEKAMMLADTALMAQSSPCLPAKWVCILSALSMTSCATLKVCYACVIWLCSCSARCASLSGCYQFSISLSDMQCLLKQVLTWVLLDLPGLLFFSTYTLLVLFWAEIYYQVIGGFLDIYSSFSLDFHSQKHFFTQWNQDKMW